MIRITAELISANDGMVSHLGTAIIFNDGSGSTNVGNYGARFSRKGDRELVRTPWRASRVEGFPRQRLGMWDLLYRALDAAVGDRNP